MDLSDLDLSKLTDLEIIELEALIKEQENDHLRAELKNVYEYTNPNYAFLFTSLRDQLYEGNKLVKGYRGVILEGSSRSGKTWSGIDFIIYICLFLDPGCTINIVRENFADFPDTLYEDFRRRLDDFFLPNPFHRAKIVKSFKINGCTIKFLGSDKIGKKHGAGCDYLFFNEMIHIDEAVFKQLEMRCRKFWWGDYNPSVTEHYVFNSVITRSDIGFLRTTFKDNKHISTGELNTIMISEPWLPGSYEIVNNSEVWCVNKLNGRLEPITDKNQPPPHPINVKQRTDDEFYWKVYGLGLRGAMKGVIFKNIVYIPEFPDMGHIYGNDFGFTTDPNATVKFSENETDIFVELLLYQPMETPELLDAYFDNIQMDRGAPMICDSSDKFVRENKGTIEMVNGLIDLGWNADKVSKTMGVMFWITSMKKKRINIVLNDLTKFAKKEAENYRMREIHGVSVNQPIDAFNHFWDATRYAHMEWNSPENQIIH